MSEDLAKTIDRLELWAEYWQPQQPEKLIADLRTVIGAAKAVSRALQALQKAQRYAPENAGEMEACTQGEWIAIDDIVKAIQILQEGQQ